MPDEYELTTPKISNGARSSTDMWEFIGMHKQIDKKAKTSQNNGALEK